MKMVKRIISMMVLVLLVFIVNTTIVKATITVKVTTEQLNLRKEASTQSDVVTILSQGNTCELIEEKGDWYKVKYKDMIGYVSKEYVKKNEDSMKENDGKSDSTVDNDASITGKIVNKTDVKIVPLIYSSKIGDLAENTTVTILTETNGWSYVETDTVIGWIRSEAITGKKENSITAGAPVTQEDHSIDNSNTTDNNQTGSTEKTMYVAESAVNVREEPNTSSKIMMELSLNTKLTVIGESGDWYQVKTSQGNGYVLKILLSDKQKGKTTSRGGNLLDHVTTVNEEKQKETAVKESTNTTNVVQTKKDSVTDSIKTTSNKISSSSEKGKEVVQYAKKFLGVKYVYGGASKSGFDCSGFTMYVYKNFGISMRHGAQAQAKIGKEIKTDKKSASSLKQNLQPGDLVFFLDYETMDEIGHCGIYIGDGKFIHASSGSGYCVKINSLLPGEYYNKRYCAARRVL